MPTLTAVCALTWALAIASPHALGHSIESISRRSCIWHDDDPMSDHPFGSYYHWCALLCDVSGAALEHGLLSPLQLDAIRPDLEVNLLGLGCGQLLVVPPASLEDQPRILDLLRDEDTLGGLRC
jgi:hypothetical protein